MEVMEAEFDPNGEYEDLSLLARGPKGTTWRAKTTSTNRDVTLKVRPRTADSEAIAFREASIFQAIRHPNLQRLNSLNAQESYLVFQYDFVSGQSLRDILETNGSLTSATAKKVLVDILNALSELHSHDIAHRDISPENIILNDQGAVLIDFDATGFLDESSPMGATTVVGNFAGKFLYMSPEGLAGAPQNSATDIWALGAVYYEMVVGTPLRRGVSPAEILSESLNPQDLSLLPEPGRSLALQMLAIDAVQRSSAAQLLMKLATDQPTVKTATMAKADSTFVLPPVSETTPELLATEVSKYHLGSQAHQANKFLPSLVVGIVLAFLGATFVFYWLKALNSPSFEMDNDVLLAIGLLFIGTVLCIFGLLMLQRQLRRPPQNDLAENLKEMIGVDGADGRKALMRTVIGNLEPEVKRGSIVPVQIAALAQEYVGAKDSSARLEALKLLIDVHYRASNNNRSIWRSPERLIQRGISLTSLAGGAAAAFEGASRLFS